MPEIDHFLKERLEELAPDALLTYRWDDFYRTYTKVVRSIAARFHFKSSETDDLVQEVWARVIVHLPKCQWRSRNTGLRSWLYALVRNKALDLLRRRKRKPMQLGEALADVVDPHDGPAEAWEAAWDRELVQQLLGNLEKRVSALNYRLLVLRWIEERPLPEVARLLNLSERQVSYRQQRLFRKLRAMLAVYRGDHFVTGEVPATASAS